jgi:hypothetical protein
MYGRAWGGFEVRQTSRDSGVTHSWSASSQLRHQLVMAPLVVVVGAHDAAAGNSRCDCSGQRSTIASVKNVRAL